MGINFNLNDFQVWADAHQGVLAVYLFLITIFFTFISWLLKCIFKKDIDSKGLVELKKYVQKNGKQSTNIQAEQVILNNHKHER